MVFKQPAGRLEGKARAFFNCSASWSAIRLELENIRSDPEFKVPSAVKLNLTTVKKIHPKDDRLLSEEVKNALYYGIKYSLKATYPGATNEDAAVELNTILVQAYQSQLYKEGEKLVGQIFYEKDGKFSYM